jgi:hypothetical protein
VQSGLGPHAVLGVIPEALTPREISSELIGDTKVVNDMHERKVKPATVGCHCCASSDGDITCVRLRVKAGDA